MGRNAIFRLFTWLNLRRSAQNWGQGFPKCLSFLPPAIGHVTRRMRSDSSRWW